MSLRHATRAVGFAAAIFLLSGTVGATLTRLELQRTSTEQAPVYLPKAEYLRPMALGYENVLADILWFRTISYFGEHYRSNRVYPWLAYMCELVTDLDPRALHVYKFAGVILPWEAEQVEAGNRLLEKGTQVFPDEWILHYYLGFNHFFFENDYRRSVERLKVAAKLPGVHPSVAKLAALLATEQYGPEVTRQFLVELESTVPSADVREVVQRHRLEAELAADLSRIDTAIAEYLERHGQPPPSLEDLVREGLLAEVPQEPFGASYEIEPRTGKARSSSGRLPSPLYESKMRREVRRGQSVRDH